MSRFLPDLLLVGAATSFVVGLYRLYEPLAWMGGAIVLLLAARAEVQRQRGRPPDRQDRAP